MRAKIRSSSFPCALVACIVLVTALTARAQTETFSDPNVGYSFVLPEAAWKMTSKPSPTSPNVEYVYGDRYDGHLEVRKVAVPQGSDLGKVIEDEEQKLQFRPGFVSGKDETFSGKLKGTVFNFEYVAAGRSMSGRFYFLKANETTIYVLRFSGQKDSLRGIRNQTDSIARTFAVK
jgi:hypothetical protein